MVSFTGGTESGRRIARIAAEKLMPAGLELGGKSPHIVFADANLEAAVTAVAGGIFEASGQSCVAGSRLFVERKVLCAGARDGGGACQGAEGGSAPGSRSADGTDRDLRPPRSGGALRGFRQARRRMHSHRWGASRRPDAGARGVLPAHRDQRASRFRHRVPAGDLRAGAVRARLRRRGGPGTTGQRLGLRLAAGLWTADYQRAWRVARRLDAGTIWINTYKQLSISTPFGGFKESGIGREKGIGGVRLFQQAKSLYWGLDTPLAGSA